MHAGKMAALTAALVAAAGLGAAFAPAAHGQNARVVTPGQVEVFGITGGGRLGLGITDVASADVKPGQPAGVRIDQVTEGSAAGKAGVRVGDVVVEYDGERVRSARQFTRLVQESVPGRAVPMTVQRDGQRQSLTVTPEEGGVFRQLGEDLSGLSERLRGLRAAPAPPPAPPAPPAPRSWPFPDVEAFVFRGTALGLSVDDLTPQLAEYFGAKEGVLVRAVAEESPADKAGIKAGDVVTALNGTAVPTSARLRGEIQRLPPAEAFTVEVVRDRKRMTLKGKTEERRDVRRSFRTEI